MALKIPWEYCECGCKSCDVTIGGMYFSYHDNLRGRIYLSQSHHPYLSRYAKEFQTMRQVNQEVRRVLRENLPKLKAQRDELKTVLAELEE